VNELKIDVEGGRRQFEPGETVEVFAEWRLDTRPDYVEVRLVWYTQGKGDRDWKQVDHVRFDGAQSYESRRCRLDLPHSPYSFSGKLISLLWSLELVAEPAGESQRLDITIAPGRQEVLLDSASSD
jgi:hypothetical protein